LIRPSLFGVLLLGGFAAGAAQPYRVDTLGRAPTVQYPVSVAFVPGGAGKFFFTEKNSGRVRVYDRGIQPEPFLTLPVEDEGEQGLRGLAFHPAYPDTPFVFVFYTRKIDRSNVVERYTDSGGVGVDPRLVLVVPRRDDGTINNGGALAFGPDGTLFIGVGDYGTPAQAQDVVARRNYWGKILRVNIDGSFPADNPFPRNPIWAYGVRDPQGIAFDPLTGDMVCTDGGTQGKNAVHLVTREANLGWPLRGIGRKPLVAFGGDEQPALSSVAVYRGEAFPRLRGKLLIAGNLAPVLWTGTFFPAGDSLALERLFVSNTGFADVRVSPTGSIVLSNGPYLGSRLLRLSPVAPAFNSSPPLRAIGGELYRYTPTFTGTPPSLTLENAPAGMSVDPETWSVVWIPSKAQALAGLANVSLLAENGAGTVEQHWRIRVTNVNDPPLPFALSDTTEETIVSFSGTDPVVELSWTATTDPDGDRVSYRVQLDTSLAFDSPLHRDTLVTGTDTLRVVLPKASHDYLWRVAATDGTLMTFAVPVLKRMKVNYQPGAVQAPEAATEEIPAPVPELPPAPSSLKYTLRRGGHVRLSVFNLLGQEVVRVFDGQQEEGPHEVALTSLNLPNGVYIYRLQAPGVFDTRKVVIAQ
jgi:glucose/arabinose dehydrogenase